MRVTIIGGTGVFGSRLARMLRKDGHTVTIASTRPQAARSFADEIGAAVVQFDRAQPTDHLFADKPDIIVDAAGPFQAYGERPYRLAAAAIENRVHYLDFSDDSTFCIGIADLDSRARQAGVFALSGVSSVPALSSAVVGALSNDMEDISRIDTAILPGNRAPRGKSVMAAIMGQAGRPGGYFANGQPGTAPNWSNPKAFRLSDGTRRRAWQIEVPDSTLFGPFFSARNVTFRAGLELPIMNYSLWGLSALRARIPIPVGPGFVSLAHWLADRLQSLGTDTGGMVVNVTGHTAHRWTRATWSLLMTGGDGPFIPATPARAIINNPERVSPGARPALCELPLHSFVDAMDGLNARITETRESLHPEFPKVLQEEFHKLAPAVRASHQVYDTLTLDGTAQITTGRSLWARALRVLFRFPSATDATPVRVVKTRTERGETWERRFGNQTFRSHLTARPDGMEERFGPFAFLLNLHAQGGALHFPVRSARFFGVPWPKRLLPGSDASEREVAGEFEFDVKLTAPLTGALIVHYKGRLAPVAEKLP